MPTTRERRQLAKQQRHEHRREQKRRSIRNRPPEKPQAIVNQGPLAPRKMGRKMRIALIVTSVVMVAAFVLGTPGITEVFRPQ